MTTTLGISLLTALVLGSTHSLSAQECNFDKPVGTCTGSVKLLSTSGSKPSFSAEIRVSSSAPKCSKVEYYLDSTPNTTVLRNRNRDEESLFSKRPISRKNITVKSCSVFASAAEVGTNGSGKQAGENTSTFFAGRWSGSVGLFLIRATLNLDISVHGNSARGVSSSANDPDIPFNGTIRGDTLTYRYPEPINGARVDVTVRRKTDKTVSYTGKGSGISFTGTLTRQ